MAMMKKTTKNKLYKDVQKKEPSCIVVGLKIESPMENSMEFSKKLQTELPYDPAISLLGIYPKKIKVLI